MTGPLLSWAAKLSRALANTQHHVPDQRPTQHSAPVFSHLQNLFLCPNYLLGYKMPAEYFYVHQTKRKKEKGTTEIENIIKTVRL